MSLRSAVLRRSAPRRWDRIHKNYEMILVELNCYSSEYDRIAGQIGDDFELDEIVRVQNPYLLGAYKLRKKECEIRDPSTMELELFHVTSADSVDSIVEDNLDWRRVTRSKFGKGVSFTPYPVYGNQYCNNSIGPNRAIILAKVLFGSWMPGKKTIVVPPEGCDTTCGNGDNVYVKYNDNEFLPMYVAYYTAY